MTQPTTPSSTEQKNHAPAQPGSPPTDGRFGPFGGRYVSEILIPNLTALEEAWRTIVPQADFQAEFRSLLKDYVGRPTPLYFAERLTEKANGAQI